MEQVPNSKNERTWEEYSSLVSKIEGLFSSLDPHQKKIMRDELRRMVGVMSEDGHLQQWEYGERENAKKQAKNN